MLRARSTLVSSGRSTIKYYQPLGSHSKYYQSLGPWPQIKSELRVREHNPHRLRFGRGVFPTLQQIMPNFHVKESEWKSVKFADHQMLLLKVLFLHYHKSCLTSDINPHKGVWVSASLKTEIFLSLQNISSKYHQMAFALLWEGYPWHFMYLKLLQNTISFIKWAEE